MNFCKRLCKVHDNDELYVLMVMFLTEADRLKDTQDVKSRIDLRENLKCQNFEWYLTNVWQQHFMPMKGRFFGKVNN